MKMDRGELFAHVDAWSMGHDFWNTSDWMELFSELMDKGFTFDEASNILESIMGLTRQEYGE